MKFSSSKAEHPRRLRATEVMATPEGAPVLFSAKEALLPRLDALRADRKNLNQSGRIGLPIDLARLSLLLPEHTAAEQAALKQQEITLEAISNWGDHMVLLLIFKNSDLTKPLLDTLRQKFTREALKKGLVDSLDPRYRPSTWTVLMNRLLYPDAPDLDSEDGLRQRLVDRIIGLQKYNPTMQGDAADFVLIHPELKTQFQAHFIDLIAKFIQGELFDHLFSSSMSGSDSIREAFNLEVLYGDMFEGLDRQGKMKYKEKSLSTSKPLPERELA